MRTAIAAAPARLKGRRAADSVLDEHIRLPGVPQIVVTRQYAYRWLLAAGYDPRARGFASMDYLVFYPGPLDEPLTDVTEPGTARFLNAVAADIRAMTDDRDTDPDPPEPHIPREGE